MRRSAAPIVVATLALATTSLRAQSTADTGQYDPCPHADTQAALTRCADSVARRADVALNTAYRRAFTRSDEKRRVLLRDAQRKWLAFRDAHCVDEAAEYAGGSMYPMQLLFCRASLADARGKQLRLRDAVTSTK